MRRAKMRRVKACIFGCGAPADSREHSPWSDWIIRRFATLGVRGSINGVEFHDPTQKSVRVKCVCQSCNTTWMKALEDAVVPIVGGMMDGRTTPLDSEARGRLAKWAIKNAMVFEQLNPDDPIFFSDHERSEFREHGQIPRRVTVLAARATPRAELYARTHLVHGRSMTHEVLLSLYTAGFSVLVVQVVAVKSTLDHGVLEPIIRGERGPWRSCLQQVWPETSQFDWPPPESIVGSLDDLHHRLSFGERGDG